MARIRNRYNQAPYLTQVTTSQLDITNESQDVSPFPAGEHKASDAPESIPKIKTEITQMIHKRSTVKKKLTGGFKPFFKLNSTEHDISNAY